MRFMDLGTLGNPKIVFGGEKEGKNGGIGRFAVSHCDFFTIFAKNNPTYGY